jgi:hypothetical protein
MVNRSRCALDQCWKAHKEKNSQLLGPSPPKMALFLSAHMNQQTKVGKLRFYIAQFFKDSATETPFQP